MKSPLNSAKPHGEGSPPIRYFNNAALALNELYEAAVVNDGALEELRHFADQLLESAGKWRRVKYLKK
ncbi:MAG: hypothetical protein ABSB82_16470 [Terriglobia bacterium]